MTAAAKLPQVGRVVPNAPWPVVRLGDVAETSSGGTPKRTSSAYYGGGIPWVKSGELGDSTVYETSETISKAGLEGSSAKIFPKGTLCVALYGATVGKLGILGVDAATNQAVCGIFLPAEIDTRFAYRFLESKRRQLVESAKGGAQPNISQEIIRNLQFPLPPLTEQRRIVAEIEKQFTRLDAGIAALRRTQANLKRYRAAVLKAAIGADESPRIALVDLVEPGAKVLYGILQPGPEIPEGIPYVRPTEIYLDKIQLGEIRKTSREIAAKYTRSTLRTGDIILSIVGTIGKVATVPAELNGGNITQSSVRIRPDSAKVHGGYLAWVLRSPFAVKQYDAARLGTAVPRLNVAHVRDLQIPIPPLAEQTRIVAEVERRLSVVEELETVVNTDLQRATRLRQSILQRAFNGHLMTAHGTS
jgi:type I restriction enzyme S subunit